MLGVIGTSRFGVYPDGVMQCKAGPMKVLLGFTIYLYQQRGGAVNVDRWSSTGVQGQALLECAVALRDVYK
eukprot:939548-Alexandrium_andersonii.AAC.1